MRRTNATRQRPLPRRFAQTLRRTWWRHTHSSRACTPSFAAVPCPRPRPRARLGRRRRLGRRAQTSHWSTKPLRGSAATSSSWRSMRHSRLRVSRRPPQRRRGMISSGRWTRWRQRRPRRIENVDASRAPCWLCATKCLSCARYCGKDHHRPCRCQHCHRHRRHRRHRHRHRRHRCHRRRRRQAYLRPTTSRGDRRRRHRCRCRQLIIVMATVSPPAQLPPSGHLFHWLRIWLRKGRCGGRCRRALARRTPPRPTRDGACHQARGCAMLLGPPSGGYKRSTTRLPTPPPPPDSVLRRPLA